MIKYDAGLARHTLGRREFYTSQLGTRGDAFLKMIVLHPWDVGPLDAELTYSAPDKPFLGIVDSLGDPLYIDQLFTVLKDEGYESSCITMFRINLGTEYVDKTAPEFKQIFPNGFDYAFMHSNMVPTVVNLDVSILNMIESIYTRFLIKKISRRNIVIDRSVRHKVRRPASKRNIKMSSR